MIVSREVTVSETPQSLDELLGIQTELRGGWNLRLQTPTGNTQDILLGNKNGQHYHLPANTLDMQEFYKISFGDFWVVSVSGDQTLRVFAAPA